MTPNGVDAPDPAPDHHLNAEVTEQLIEMAAFLRQRARAIQHAERLFTRIARTPGLPEREANLAGLVSGKLQAIAMLGRGAADEITEILRLERESSR